MNQNSPDAPAAPIAASAHPTFSEAFRFWLKLGFISFGGPSGQIAIMHTELVDKKRWIGEQRFLHALNYCMLLPGPEATQLATYCGWLLHGTKGGLAAGVLFILPAIFLLWGLSYIYAAFGTVPWIAAVFYGLKPAVMAIVAAAVLRIGTRALKNGVMWSLAGSAFVAIFFFDSPFPAIVFGAACIGLLGGMLWKDKFEIAAGPGGAGRARAAPVIADHHESPEHTKPSLRKALRTVLVCLTLWWTPVLAAGASGAWQSTLFQQGIFFSEAAMVTFGGAYAVLPYVAQRAVADFHWLTPAQMMDGLGLAETTPGPLIMVLQFVGFMGGWNHPEGMDRLCSATLGALMTTWTTFVPCFLWIFLGAPYIEHWRGNARLTHALSAVTAAVVGVILNLAVWFGLHALFPATGTLDLFALIVAVGAFAGMTKWKWDLLLVVLGCGLLGMIYRLSTPEGFGIIRF
ncbi:MAG: chromate efflux transporter [Planctomycetes bacterium]|nr:chromate efflux transporter [Planctomycetota bacterium]